MKTLMQNEPDMASGGADATGVAPIWLLQHWYSPTQPFAPPTSPTANGGARNTTNNIY